MNYGKAIRLARAARQLSQRQLAALVDLNPSYVSLIEGGHRIPSLSTVENLAEVLQVPMGLFMLLASEEKDLRGLPPDQARILGEQLLALVMATQEHSPP